MLGEEKNEQIFGYSNLKIELFFTASKLNQYYRKTFTEAIPKTLDGIEPDNIEEALIKSEILQQENGAQSIEHFADLVRQDQKFKPFGRKLHDLSVVYNTLQDSSTRHYEIYFANTQSPGFREVVLLYRCLFIIFFSGIKGWRLLFSGLSMVVFTLTLTMSNGNFSFALKDSRTRKLVRIDGLPLASQLSSNTSHFRRIKCQVGFTDRESREYPLSMI